VIDTLPLYTLIAQQGNYSRSMRLTTVLGNRTISQFQQKPAFCTSFQKVEIGIGTTNDSDATVNFE
jgi:hypothetical protein